MATNGNAKFSFSFGGAAALTKPGAAAVASTSAPPAPMSNLEMLLAKAKAPQLKAAGQAKKPISFDDGEEEDSTAVPRDQPVASGSRPKPSRPKPSLLDGPPAPAPSHIKPTTTMSRAEKRLQSEALALDSSAFQYDEVYDNIKAAERKVEQAKKEDTSERKSKYMESFLESARRRKMDALHAEEKMMQIEREKEGGEFDDKEKFVTSAYKAQMEEVRKAEEEERKKEGELVPLSQDQDTSADLCFRGTPEEQKGAWINFILQIHAGRLRGETRCCSGFSIGISRLGTFARYQATIGIARHGSRR